MSQFVLEIALAIGGAVLGVIGQLLRRGVPRTVLTILGALLLAGALALAVTDLATKWIWKTGEPSAYQLTRAAWTSTPTPTEARPIVPTLEPTRALAVALTATAIGPAPTATPTPTSTLTPAEVRPSATPKPTRTPRPTSTPRPTKTTRPTSTPRPTAEYDRLMLSRKQFGSSLQRIQVVKLPSKAEETLLELSGRTRYNKLYSAAWSPEGDRVLIALRWQSGRADGAIVLRVIEVSTGQTRDILTMPITGFYREISNALWSPDGSWIAFFLIDGGNNGIYRINADGSGLQRLDQSVTGEWPRYWSLDGQWLITIAGDQLLWALEVNGGRRVPFSSLGSLPLQDQRYYRWRQVKEPKCADQADSWWKCK